MTKAVGLYEYGGPEVLKVIDLPEAHAAAGQVRIRVHAATVNPTDTTLRKGGRAAMLKDVGCSHVIVGHSERRADHHETDLESAAAVHHALIRLGIGRGIGLGPRVHDQSASQHRVQASAQGRQQMQDIAIKHERCGAHALRIRAQKQAADEMGLGLMQIKIELNPIN